MAPTFNIIPIPAFNDNYIWLIHDNNDAVVVDPGDAAPVIAFLSAHNLNLQSILITHHHNDHIDGVPSLQQRFPLATTYAPKHERYDFTHRPTGEPDVVECQFRDHTLSMKVLDVPGHTLGHIAYYALLDAQPILFCGDTLFGAGCGRLFEGTPAQMLNSLNKINSLPNNTLIYCTHEYTETNIAFALTLEPDNEALITRAKQTAATRQAQQPSLPSTMDLERLTNPFLRCKLPQMKRITQEKNPSELQTFTTIRSLKDHF